MGIKIDIEVQGLIEAQRNAERMIAGLHGAPVLNAMRDSTLKLEREAKLNLVGYQSLEVGGVDTGRLRASITPEVSMMGSTVQGVVGSNVEYAPYVEWTTRPHWTSVKNLQVWADRHGVNPYVVKMAIHRRGTIGKKFLTRAWEKSVDYIKARFERAWGEVFKS
jgi:phage gpG-like protein